MMDYDFVDSLLENMGLSRRQLAIKSGINPGTMSTWFARRTKNIPFLDIQKMANVLQVPWYKIMGLEEYAEDLYARFPGVKELDDEDIDIPFYNKDGELIYTSPGGLLNKNESAIITPFRSLNDAGQKKAIDAVEMIAKIPEYQARKGKKKKG